ncbi:MAG TPA: long-chain fatty acid--CoA ligase [Candidatus Acidoferrum sp.]|jgi:long-chain acyl-CoA synthetase|nr:long-chain fatty acid--CoA ligase [Candidatus Acidoferrum sp.]
MNLARLGEDSLQTWGEYVSLAFEGREWTNVEQQRVANRFARALRRLGLEIGDRVVVLLPNCPEVLQAYAGILKAGGVIVPVVFLLGPDEVRHILADSEAKVVVTAPELLGKIEGWTGTVVLVGAGPGGLAWDEVVAAEPETFATVDRDDGDLAVILYTAGTTGRPKGVALSHANLASNAQAAASLYELDRTAWSLMVLPLSHSYGLTVMNAGSILGTRGVLLRWFNPEGVLDTIQRYRVESMAGVPTMFVYLLHYPDAGRFDTSSMRSWGSGAAPLPLEIVEPFEKKFGGRILEGYGLTEASPVVSAHRFSGVRKLGSVGPPIPGVEVAILDEADGAMPVGEVGEVCVRGPNVMQGYYRLPDETRHTLRNGWLHTGDMGRLDADGYLYIVERKKDLIIRGGFNIYPREVEEVLYAHPAVAEVAVVGMRDPLMGEEVLAFVALKRGAATNADALIEFCQERLAKYKCPKQVRFVEALPKSPIGKILRKELRSLA